MKRRRFLTAQENHNIEKAIYNNTPLVLDEFVQEEDNVEDAFIEGVLLKGETLTELIQEDYAVTSMGRLFNLRHKRQLSPVLFPLYISAVLRNTHVRFIDVLAEAGIDITHEEIIANYKKNKWPFVLPILYRNQKKHNKLYKPFR